jgi:hypothetical protein
MTERVVEKVDDADWFDVVKSKALRSIEDVAAALRRRKLAIQRGHALASFDRIDRTYRGQK